MDKVSTAINKEFDSDPVCNKKKLKTKIKAYGDEATNLHNKQISKASSNYTCLAVMNVYSALKKHGNYDLQAFLKEWKYTDYYILLRT